MTEGEGPVGVGASFGSFGELLQGVLPDGDQHFLVTLPIASWSTATFQYSLCQSEVEVRPPHKRKSVQLARRLLDRFGASGGGFLEIVSDIPEGKGLASSSADLVATARAVGRALEHELDAIDFEALLREIEPSDGVMYPEVVAFYHREVRLRERLGVLPSMTIIAYDTGGQVDTISHNLHLRRFSEHEKREYQRLLKALGRAVRSGDLPAVGAVATRSALMYAGKQTRPEVGHVLRLCEAVGGLGVALAHSGTMLGILLRSDDTGLEAKVAYVRHASAATGGSFSVFRSLGVESVWIPDQLTHAPAEPKGSSPPAEVFDPHRVPLTADHHRGPGHAL